MQMLCSSVRASYLFCFLYRYDKIRRQARSTINAVKNQGIGGVDSVIRAGSGPSKDECDVQLLKQGSSSVVADLSFHNKEFQAPAVELPRSTRKSVRFSIDSELTSSPVREVADNSIIVATPPVTPQRSHLIPNSNSPLGKRVITRKGETVDRNEKILIRRAKYGCKFSEHLLDASGELTVSGVDISQMDNNVNFQDKVIDDGLLGSASTVVRKWSRSVPWKVCLVKIVLLCISIIM